MNSLVKVVGAADVGRALVAGSAKPAPNSGVDRDSPKPARADALPLLT